LGVYGSFGFGPFWGLGLAANAAAAAAAAFPRHSRGAQPAKRMQRGALRARGCKGSALLRQANTLSRSQMATANIGSTKVAKGSSKELKVEKVSKSSGMLLICLTPPSTRGRARARL
jgi:hypothetical protein